MAFEKEQVKPLAPTAYQIRSDEEEAPISAHLNLRQRKYIKCCGCLAAIVLMQAVTVLVLIFTVFRIKDPAIKMNGIFVEHLEVVNGTLRSDVNITAIADVSVKNPNVAAFRFSNSTTTLYYGGAVIGETRNPAGQAKARRTLRMNVTVDIVPEKILGVPNLERDLDSKVLILSSYTRISGKVRILKIFKKVVVVKLNCTMTYNISSRAIEEDECRRHFKM